jgi:hypothetical protein
VIDLKVFNAWFDSPCRSCKYYIKMAKGLKVVCRKLGYTDLMGSCPYYVHWKRRSYGR